MDWLETRAFIERKFWHAYGATDVGGFDDYVAVHSCEGLGAALGYRRAGAEALFLEQYLDEPVELAISTLLGREIERPSIVEIGNLASKNAWSMIALWAAAANDLGSSSEVAVATLTRPLRQMFARIGVPIKELAAARPERLALTGAVWGTYFRSDPRVYVGSISDGQRSISAFFSRRERTAA
jgi:hypothetical protein